MICYVVPIQLFIIHYFFVLKLSNISLSYFIINRLLDVKQNSFAADGQTKEYALGLILPAIIYFPTTFRYIPLFQIICTRRVLTFSFVVVSFCVQTQDLQFLQTLYKHDVNTSILKNKNLCIQIRVKLASYDIRFFDIL